VFTVETARAALTGLRPTLDRLIAVRADAVELGSGEPTALGGLPELKAAQAALDELVTEVQESGAILKGIAPLLLDFPAELDGVGVQLCWLEGDAELGWYHRNDLGFAGRRKLAR
jgi:hypothetical protein